MKITLDVVDFKKEMKRLEKEVLERGTMEVHEQIDLATDNLRVVTPVDTGKARKGWKNKKINSLGGQTGEISNDVEYIDILNKGHSKQAPKYFIEQVLTKIGILTP